LKRLLGERIVLKKTKRNREGIENYVVIVLESLSGHGIRSTPPDSNFKKKPKHPCQTDSSPGESCV
jgi:hypothetical protein